MIDSTDTITAVATAPGPGGVGIIRISGPAALEVGLFLFTPLKKPLEKPEPNRLYFGEVSVKADQRFVAVKDKGYLVFMQAPFSFTGEDVVELHCHGGPLLLKKILEGVLREGGERVRLAEPGEFTKRAFLNGKLDLSEASAVAELINATTESALAMAGSRMFGVLSSEIRGIKEKIVDLVTLIEAELDFAEEEIDAISDRAIMDSLKFSEERMAALIKTYDQGSALTEGVKVVITGRPNTGKSSLLNRLLKEERAIVTPNAGTTRDVIEESVAIKGLPARLMDTAGLRGGVLVPGEAVVDEVEAIGIERARERARNARVVFFVVDGGQEDHAKDKELLQSLMEDEGENDLPLPKRSFIIVANKSDKAGNKEEVVASLRKSVLPQQTVLPVVLVSALSGDGIDELEMAFFKAVTGYDHGEGKAALQGEAFITTLREKDALTRALNATSKSIEAVAGKVARECLALELKVALTALGEISGETTSEDILNRIFSSFCIGK